MSSLFKQLSLIGLFAISSSVVYAGSTFDSAVFRKGDDCSMCKLYSGYYAQKFQDGRVKLGVYLKKDITPSELTLFVEEGTKLSCMHTKTSPDGDRYEFNYECK